MTSHFCVLHNGTFYSEIVMSEIFHFIFNIRVLFNLFDENFMVIEMCNFTNYLTVHRGPPSGKFNTS